MYSGRRREMLPYFAFIEFPCPAYKNPSDYYRMIYYRDTVNLTNVCHLNSDPLLSPLCGLSPGLVPCILA